MVMLEKSVNQNTLLSPRIGERPSQQEVPQRPSHSTQRMLDNLDPQSRKWIEQLLADDDARAAAQAVGAKKQPNFSWRTALSRMWPSAKGVDMRHASGVLGRAAVVSIFGSVVVVVALIWIVTRGVDVADDPQDGSQARVAQLQVALTVMVGILGVVNVTQALSRLKHFRLMHDD